MMTREDVNWLLETIGETEKAKGFVLAQLECGRITRAVMVELAQERGWKELVASPLANAAAAGLGRCAGQPSCAAPRLRVAVA